MAENGKSRVVNVQADSEHVEELLETISGMPGVKDISMTRDRLFDLSVEANTEGAATLKLLSAIRELPKVQFATTRSRRDLWTHANTTANSRLGRSGLVRFENDVFKLLKVL